MRDGWFGDDECARDLVGGETAEQAQRQRHARFRGKNRVAGREHQPQQIVTDLIVERIVEIRHAHFLLGVQLVPDLLVFALDAFAAAMHVNRAMLGGGHEPGSGIVRHS